MLNDECGKQPEEIEDGKREHAHGEFALCVTGVGIPCFAAPNLDREV